MRGAGTGQSGAPGGLWRFFLECLWSKAVALCFLGMGGLCIGMILAVAGTERALIGLLAAAYVTVILLWVLVSGFLERRRMAELERLLESLPERHLLGEVLPKPVNSLEKRYFRIMKELSRACLGIAEQERREKEAYCDYVESWIHEMKTPLTACSLILDNGGDGRKLRRELKRADNLTESILYYARLRTAQKDIKIREFSVAAVVDEAVKSQMELLIGAKIRVETEGDFRVSSDGKSLCFILKQMLINCAKYCPGCQVRISAKEGEVSVRDDGPGIPAHELRRVTERGFTGSRGRSRVRIDPARDGTEALSGSRDFGDNASGGTGMGLYIAKELCRRLGITMTVESEEGEYTCITLSYDCLADRMPVALPQSSLQECKER